MTIKQAPGWNNFILLLAAMLFTHGARAELVNTVTRIRPSIVGIGTHVFNRSPANILSGTGFAVGDGRQILTNAHVAKRRLDEERKESLVVFVGRGRKPQIRRARIVTTDLRHDLAVLSIDGAPVPPLRLAAQDDVREGQTIAFTGFPIGAVLGLYPVTHTGIVAAISPIAIPAPSTRSLTAAQIKRLRDPFDVYQLDATAYPGNSGSPVYEVHSGTVIGVVNSVLVKSSKENILKDPSAITYAIPIVHARSLLSR